MPASQINEAPALYGDAEGDELGWVKLYRKIIGSDVFRSHRLLTLWVYCLCVATYKERYIPIKSGMGETLVLLKPGQFITGRHELGRILRCSPSSAFRALHALKVIGNVDMEMTHHFTIVTICNWERYQNTAKINGQQNEQPVNSQWTTSEQPVNTNNKGKKDKKGKNKETTMSGKPDVESVFNHHCQIMGTPDHPRTWKLTTDLHKRIIARLKTYTVAELTQAADNLSKSAFHRGENEHGTEYCDPLFLYRSDAQVSKWLATKQQLPDLPETADTRYAPGHDPRPTPVGPEARKLLQEFINADDNINYAKETP